MPGRHQNPAGLSDDPDHGFSSGVLPISIADPKSFAGVRITKTELFLCGHFERPGIPVSRKKISRIWSAWQGLVLDQCRFKD